MLTRYGATGFRTASEGGRTAIAFSVGRHRFRFMYDPSVPAQPAGAGRPGAARNLLQPRSTAPGTRSEEEASRRYWHKLSMLIRAKLEAVAEGIASFDEEFLAYMVLPGGQTVLQNVGPGIARAYSTGTRTSIMNDGGR